MKDKLRRFFVNLAYLWTGFCIAWGLFLPQSSHKAAFSMIGGIFALMLTAKFFDEMLK
jgi:hypothetical protein